MNQSDYDRVERAILYLEKSRLDQPSLGEAARQAGVSPFHFQRLFKRWAGLSPKRFLQYLTVEDAKRRLQGSQSVLEAAYGAGLSGPGRLHDLFVAVEAMTPGQYKAQGAGLTIAWGVHETPFGPALVAVTQRGVCGLAFLGKGGEAAALKELKRKWPKSRFVKDAVKSGAAASRIFRSGGGPPVKVLLKGTTFQVKVWEALLKIPAGAVCAYKDVAGAIGKPKAVRAVGTAIGQNTIAYLIPCHRVIRDTGVLGNYKWGPARKRVLLSWEGARKDATG